MFSSEGSAQNQAGSSKAVGLICVCANEPLHWNRHNLFWDQLEQS